MVLLTMPPPQKMPRRGLNQFPDCTYGSGPPSLERQRSVSPSIWEPLGCSQSCSMEEGGGGVAQWETEKRTGYPGTRGGQGCQLAGWSERAQLPLRVLHSRLEILHQVLATDFQFAKQNTFALIGKIHRKGCLDFNAAAGACRIPSLQEALLALMPSQACHLSSETSVCGAEISSLGPRLGASSPTLEGRLGGGGREGSGVLHPASHSDCAPRRAV